ncbi:ABC transporter permease [Pandoraea communis]|uniref:ABC transporter permease n=1 Tax=Pandoraea communis TaxID=2508297 RepID=UPI00158262FC|nr:ABC transporter permease [Pandoraea communis]
MNVAKQYRILYLAGFGLLGVAAAVTGLVYWLGVDTLVKYRGDLVYYTQQHLKLVAISMAMAIAVGVPAGVLISRSKFAKHAERAVQIFNIGNTLPSLAVLALSMAVLGIGDRPAILALWLASLLPIVRNAYEGLRQVPPALRESARGMGMTPAQVLFRVDLPNAMPVIVGGIRTSLAINVGTAPLAFLIGADSLGQLIFPGIYLNDPTKLLLGAAGTALLALVLDGIVAFTSGLWFARHGAPAR